jgi:hypothetical protein
MKTVLPILQQFLVTGSTKHSVLWIRYADAWLYLDKYKIKLEKLTMIPINYVQRKVVHPFLFWWVQNLLVRTFLCTWNVHFWWHRGGDRWSHLLDRSRSGRGCWSGRLGGQSMTRHSDWFRCHRWNSHQQTAEILHHKERNYFPRRSWDCSHFHQPTVLSRKYVASSCKG